MGRISSPTFSSSLILVFYAFLQHSISVNGGSDSDPPSLTQMPRDLYHSSDALLKDVQALVARHPDKLIMETKRAGNKGYVAEVVVVTYNHVKGQINKNQKFRILLSFGQHGRELITSEVALHLLSVLTGEKLILGMDPISLNTTLDNLVIKVVPMENLNGRKLVEAGDLCDRRNGRGVDLNRNWSVDWGKKEKDYDPYEENPGTAPFSEPETQIMRKLSMSFNPHIWVNVHSGMEALFMPYDHKNATPDGLTSQLMKSILEDLNHHLFQSRCLVGHGGDSVGYLAHGTATDYMHDVAKVPMSFTFEIFGDPQASSKDCFKMFNPVDLITFNRVVSDWCTAFLLIFESAPRRLEKGQVAADALRHWVSRDGDDGGLKLGGSRKLDGLELGFQEMRTYYRLFMLSLVLLMFMFCTKISKGRHKQPKSTLVV